MSKTFGPFFGRNPYRDARAKLKIGSPTHVPTAGQLAVQNLLVAEGGLRLQAATGGTGTMTANDLSSYEMGRFTPKWVLDSDGTNLQKSGGDMTYAAQYGHYSKIGDQVILTFYLQVNAAATSAAAFALGGVPFTFDTTPGGVGGGVLSTSFLATQNLALAFDGYFVTEMGSVDRIKIRTQGVNDTTAAGTPNANTYIGASTWMAGQVVVYTA